MSRHHARVPTAPQRALKLLIGTAALASLAAACGQLPAGTGQPAITQPTRSAAATSAPATPSAGIGKPSSVAIPVKHADLISGVSCVSHACTAVGAYYYGTKSEHTLVERWNGSSWRLQRPADSVRYSMLYAVSCPGVASCVAVGSPVLTWHGSGWQVSATSSPFTAVSCATAEFCLAVGVSLSGRPVYGTWRGTRWRTSSLPVPRQSATSHATIADVSCATARFCLAVGGYATGIAAEPSPAARDRTLAEEWDGQTWRRLPTPNVGNLDEFTAASCASASNCTAVGTTAGQYPIAEHWNGTSWLLQHMPLPGTIGYTQLSAVSCTGASSCTAVGNYQGLPIAEVSDGGRWHLDWLPRPAGDDSPLQSVSCTAATACMAVGVDFTALISFAARWNGARWQLLPLANPR